MSQLSVQIQDLARGVGGGQIEGSLLFGTHHFIAGATNESSICSFATLNIS